MVLATPLPSDTEIVRDAAALPDAAIIVWPYKYITGKQSQMGIWTGPVSPNGTDVGTDPGCPQGW